MIAVVALTNGRIELLDRTLESFADKVRSGELITRRVIWDDSGSDEVYHYLRLAYGPAGWVVVRPPAPEGFGGAMRSSWAWLAGRVTEPYVFWTEDDFIFEKVVPVDAMAKVLGDNPHLAQVALKRQPWNDREREAGDVTAVEPDTYTEVLAKGYPILEHRRFWTTNPSLFRSELLGNGWADDPQSEGRYTHRLLGEGLPWGVPGDQVRFAYWGARKAAPAITHIGLERTGYGY